VPSRFVDLLLLTDGACIDGRVLLGVRDATWCDRAMNIHAQDIGCYHPDLIPVMLYDDHRTYCLHIAKIKKGDCPVILWDLRHPETILQPFVAVHASFMQWLVELIGPVSPEALDRARREFEEHPPVQQVRIRPNAPMSRIALEMRIHPAIKTFRGASRGEIERAQTKLALTFPDRYREFLEQCGAADINGELVMGLGEAAADQQLDLVGNTLLERTDGVIPLREDLLPLSPTGDGGWYALDLSRVRKGDCPVVIWNHDNPLGERQSPAKLQETFKRWLISLIEEAPQA
jgi:hypothetical protein